ncbi:snoRNA-binding protein [Puccinia graminis f. sp. tritici]|uniref:SnoRNA-binding protein n=1 Tax=Puccinia graminis f. sp. tritici TaxID=56615 RepID=A0A5B0S7P3_PUCGR|nr:snoRNA-binding protein [Puccinia graminis f. sp. tritici]
MGFGPSSHLGVFFSSRDSGNIFQQIRRQQATSPSQPTRTPKHNKTMSADIEMEEQAATNPKPPSEKKSSKKRKSITTEAPDVENTTQPTEPTTTTPSKKKEKKKKGTTTTTDNEEAENESSKKKKAKQSADAENDADQNINLDAMSPIAHPLADKKLSKRVLRTVKKGSKQRRIKRGVKEVVKALRKGEKGLVVMAGDISPMDVLTHIPLLAEENGSGYIFVPTKESLGAASSTKRPTSCVMISTTRGGSEAIQKKFAEKKKAMVAADPTKAAKIQADEDEYTASFEAVLGEVLQLMVYQTSSSILIITVSNAEQRGFLTHVMLFQSLYLTMSNEGYEVSHVLARRAKGSIVCDWWFDHQVNRREKALSACPFRISRRWLNFFMNICGL